MKAPIDLQSRQHHIAVVARDDRQWTTAGGESRMMISRGMTYRYVLQLTDYKDPLPRQLTYLQHTRPVIHTQQTELTHRDAGCTQQSQGSPRFPTLHWRQPTHILAEVSTLPTMLSGTVHTEDSLRDVTAIGRYEGVGCVCKSTQKRDTVYDLRVQGRVIVLSH
ncbi:hypothetical protein AB1N83_013618 [Pleurotus pulmonarius]